jgi:hypothetical protein
VLREDRADNRFINFGMCIKIQEAGLGGLVQVVEDLPSKIHEANVS